MLVLPVQRGDGACVVAISHEQRCKETAAQPLGRWPLADPYTKTTKFTVCQTGKDAPKMQASIQTVVPAFQ